MSIILLIVGILLFIGLVVVHEWGHFITARRGGVEVEEFGIFFPPRLFVHKMKSGWNFTINLLPLGGFVKLKGEHDTDTEPGSFGAANLWTKSKIMAAGVGMNLLVALLLFTGLAWVGMPKLLCNQFTVTNDTKTVFDSRKVIANTVEANSPASAVGIKNGDQLVAVGTSKNNLQNLVTGCLKLADFTPQHAGQTIDIQYIHAGKTYIRQATLRSAAEVQASQQSKQPKGYLGIVPAQSGYALQSSTWSAPVVAVGDSAQFTGLTFVGLGRAVAGLGKLVAGSVTGNTHARQNGQTQASSQVSGPVGIFEILKDGSRLGWSFMLMIIAIVSLTLAIMNILPIPALDGGRLWLTLIAHAFKKPLSARTEELVNAAGFIVLLGIIVLVTIVDVSHLRSGLYG
ncbi:MAG TPA: M50 family metallopeptidase [Candidatus Saccharimonadales bacterium]|nr:M50 family metallopeptidase [Candidatus Saccharimonadales bacterium]